MCSSYPVQPPAPIPTLAVKAGAPIRPPTDKGREGNIAIMVDAITRSDAHVGRVEFDAGKRARLAALRNEKSRRVGASAAAEWAGGGPGGALAQTAASAR